MLLSASFAEHLLWFIFAFNAAGLVFQLRTNYTLKSTHGVSFWMLWTYHLASVSFMMYAFLLWLPLPMRVMIPVEAVILMGLVVQEMWFAPTVAFRRRITVWHGGILIGSSIAWYIGFFYPYLIGHLAGWVAVGSLSISQFPQILRHWKRKSVAGYSLWYLSLSTTSTLILLWSSYILSLPPQNWAHALRALAKRLILWWQVLVYPRD